MEMRLRLQVALPQLTHGHLNRALLARQHLLSRVILLVVRRATDTGAPPGENGDGTWGWGRSHLMQKGVDVQLAILG